MLELWPANAEAISHHDVLSMADILIGLFWTGKTAHKLEEFLFLPHLE